MDRNAQSESGDVSAKQCEANAECYALGLVSGTCCPTEDNVFLGCCENSNDHAGNPVPLQAPAVGSITDEWRGILYGIQAVVSKENALQNIKAMSNDFGSGNSKINSMMWALSRPASLDGYDDAPRAIVRKIQRECELNTACAAKGNLGFCCPIPEGWNEYGQYNSTLMDCCPRVMSFANTVSDLKLSW